jgi:hypothetical protein
MAFPVVIRRVFISLLLSSKSVAINADAKGHCSSSEQKGNRRSEQKDEQKDHPEHKKATKENGPDRDSNPGPVT